MNKRLYKVTTGFIWGDKVGYDANFDKYKVIAIDVSEAIKKVEAHGSFNNLKDLEGEGTEVVESVELISSIDIK